MDANEGNETALREEREKLRRRKAREQRLAAEGVARADADRRMREAVASQQVAEGKNVQWRQRRAELQRRVRSVQRRILTQLGQAKAGTSVAQLGRTFQLMDNDRSWTLDREELSAGMTKEGVALTAAEIDLLIDFYDNDGSGTLNYDEMVESLKSELNERRA